jgi:class 3 adenylate cyclase
MGIHMGKPECRLDPVTGRMDYFGGMVNRSARIAGIACGGQIIISQKVWDAIPKKEVTNVDMTPLGEHYLKGLKSGERLVQILPKSVAGVRNDYYIIIYKRRGNFHHFKPIKTIHRTHKNY